MITEFEQRVRANFIKAKLGERRDQIADVDVHFVLPLQVASRFEGLISEITNNDFNAAAGYNLVLLYTDPQDSQRAGTVLFGRELDGLVAAWSNVLNDIAAEPDKAARLAKFKAAHAYFRSALWVEPNPADPCASNSPLPRRSAKMRKSIWARLIN
ncbi:MAG: hypothetical protein R3D60_02520 [Paracoccaceae bacterium]